MEFVYDAAGRRTVVRDPLNRESVRTYDKQGRVAASSNPANETTGFAYNARGEQIIQTDPLDQDIIYVFDKNGNRTGLKNRRLQDYTFTYDANNRLVGLETPLGHTKTLTWNNRGLLETVTKPSTQAAAFTYDSMGRIQTQVDDAGTITFGFDANGNPTTVTEDSLSTVRTYDDRNRVETYTDAHGDTIGYLYDSNGNLTELTYPGNKTVTYVYDARKQLTSVTDWNHRATTYTYDLNGRLTGISRPNGTSRTILYNAAGEITRIEERKADGRLMNLQDFLLDDAGRITREFIAPIPQPYTVPAHTITYDADNRIAIFNGLTVVHDADGNMISGPLDANTLETYTYDARNRLTSAGGISYQYGPEGSRISQTDANGTTKYTVEPNTGLSKVLIRTNPDHSKTYYVYGMGLLYEVDEAEETLTYHYDYRGSTRQITADDGQTITDTIEYTPYGAITHRTGGTETPFLYNGMFGVMTEGSGLIYMRARYFNPYLMRFVNADPIGFDGGMNWYAYAGGNPISNIDPVGLSETSATDRILAVVFAPYVLQATDTRNRISKGLSDIRAIGNAHKMLKVSGNNLDLGPMGALAELVATDNSGYIARGYGGSIIAGNSVSKGYAVNFNLLGGDFSVQQFETRSNLDIGVDINIQSVSLGFSSVPLDQTSQALNLSYGYFGYSAIGGGEHSGGNILAHELSLSIGAPFGATYSTDQKTKLAK